MKLNADELNQAAMLVEAKPPRFPPATPGSLQQPISYSALVEIRRSRLKQRRG
jgi:hypothetical protein